MMKCVPVTIFAIFRQFLFLTVQNQTGFAQIQFVWLLFPFLEFSILLFRVSFYVHLYNEQGT